MLINLLENPHGIQFENVYSKLLQQPILGEFVSEEIDYFIFSNNSDVIPLSEALPNSSSSLSLMTCDKQDAIREYFAIERHTDVDCFYFC